MSLGQIQLSGLSAPLAASSGVGIDLGWLGLTAMLAAFGLLRLALIRRRIRRRLAEPYDPPPSTRRWLERVRQASAVRDSTGRLGPCLVCAAREPVSCVHGTPAALERLGYQRIDEGTQDAELFSVWVAGQHHEAIVILCPQWSAVPLWARGPGRS